MYAEHYANRTFVVLKIRFMFSQLEVNVEKLKVRNELYHVHRRFAHAEVRKGRLAVGPYC